MSIYKAAVFLVVFKGIGMIWAPRGRSPWKTKKKLKKLQRKKKEKKLRKKIEKNKAGYTANEVACGWAGAIFEVTRPFGQEQ